MVAFSPQINGRRKLFGRRQTRSRGAACSSTNSRNHSPLPRRGRAERPASTCAPVFLASLEGRQVERSGVELARPVLAAGTPAGRKHIEDLIKEEKLAYGEDRRLFRNHDIKLACSVSVLGFVVLWVWISNTQPFCHTVGVLLSTTTPPRS